MSLLVSATFKSRSAFETATARLERIGVTDSQIGLVMSDETRSREFANRPPYSDADNAEEGAAAGATAGGLVGALFGAVTLAGALFKLPWASRAGPCGWRRRWRIDRRSNRRRPFRIRCHHL